ncbi:MAG: Hpt domain-containing protein [Phycisphaerales bacterium]|nr:MAG: Hpt domain-containing protein [Phycisphaerales bacterium]
MPTPDQPRVPLRSDLAADPDMKELVELFVSELPARADSVINAYQSRSLDTLQRLAHQLKGASAGYGFAPIGQAAASLESQILALNTNAEDHVRSLASQVDELVELCRRAIVEP